MKKMVLVLLAVLLLFTAACAGDTGSAAATTTVAPTALSTTTPPAAAATTAAKAKLTPDPSIELPPIAEIADLIPAGYPTDNVYHAETDDPIASPIDPLYREETGCEYLFEGDYLMYTETESQNGGPLCAREGCLHALNRSRAVPSAMPTRSPV